MIRRVAMPGTPIPVRGTLRGSGATPLAPIVVHVCDDICCRDRGAVEIMAALLERFGDPRSADGPATWVTSPCLGQCDRAPAVFIQRAGQDDLVIAPANPASVLAAVDGQIEPMKIAAAGKVIRELTG